MHGSVTGDGGKSDHRRQKLEERREEDRGLVMNQGRYDGGSNVADTGTIVSSV